MPTLRPPAVRRQSSVGDQLRRLARRGDAAIARELDELVIGPAQHALLETVYAAPGISMSGAAHSLGVDKAAVSRTARRLIRSGMLVQRPRAGNARVRELFPTGTGRAVLWTAMPNDDATEARLVAGFTEEELRALDVYLARLSANLDVTPGEFFRRRISGADLRRLADPSLELDSEPEVWRRFPEND